MNTVTGDSTLSPLLPAGRVEFTDYVAARGATLLRLCVALTGSRPEAEDLLQEALARCFVRWRKIGAMDNPEGYVRRVVVTQHASMHRRDRWRLSSHMPVASEPVVSDITDDSATRDLLSRALSQLTARQRTVLVLTYFDDLPDAQIAEAVGCSVNTVKSHRAKALGRLRQLPGLDPSASGGIS